MDDIKLPGLPPAQQGNPATESKVEREVRVFVWYHAPYRLQ
jgi:hypothetical protein